MTLAILWKHQRDDGGSEWRLYMTTEDAAEAATIVQELRELGHEAKTAAGDTRPAGGDE